MAHPTIRRGSTGSAVAELQELLASKGYYYGSIDSKFGPATQQAVIAYQRDHGLVQDGVVGPKTWASLEGSSGYHPTLRLGSRGSAVREVQTKLKAQGYYYGAIDSIYGPATQQAVIAYQRAHGLVPDGIVGPKTWASLDGAGPVPPYPPYPPTPPYPPYPPTPPTPPVTHPTIRLGSTGGAVVDLEEMLTLLNYYKKPLDSVFGREVQQAVIAFQRDYRLVPDGIVGPKTWAALEAAERNIPTARVGDRNANVMILQMKLQILGYYYGAIDSVFGSTTQQAVLAFQRDHHLTPDGVVGYRTWHALIYATDTLPTLRTGSRGKAVQNLQAKLRILGYYKGSVDGIFGEQTRRAVVAFQGDHRLTQDGVVGKNTWGELEITTRGNSGHPTLRIGDRGPAVQELQLKLRQLGYYYGAIDSAFGPATQQAVIAFQRSYGLTPDGVVGPVTWAALDRATRG